MLAVAGERLARGGRVERNKDRKDIKGSCEHVTALAWPVANKSFNGGGCSRDIRAELSWLEAYAELLRQGIYRRFIKVTKLLHVLIQQCDGRKDFSCEQVGLALL